MSISMPKALIVASAMLALGVASLGVTALAAPGSTGTSTSTTLHANQPAGNSSKPAASPAFQVAGRTSEMQYVPVTPCKLVDTRSAGGKFSSGTTRTYHARGGASLASQGGSSSGCGLPQNAASMATSITAATPTHAGYLQLNASDVSSSGITAVNYGTQSITGFMNVDLAQPGSANAFKVSNFSGSTHVVIYVVGYYIAPMWAELTGAGNLVQGSRVTLARVIPGAPGQFEVIFDRDISRCAYNATAFSPNLSAEVEPRSGNANGVFVVFSNNSNVITATQFYVTVRC